jgi:ribosomal protein S18 acetylase RimI-like enzyme
MFNMTETIVRPPRLEERAPFFQIYETGLPNVDPLTFDGFSRWWNRSKVRGDLETLWRVAVADDSVVGVAINATLDSLGWGLIWELAVSPEWRNKGVGTSLVLESERALLDRNPNLTHFSVGIKVHNTRAVPFWERLGYGIQGLVLELEGPPDVPTAERRLELRIARLEDIPVLLHLIPDTSWGSHDQGSLEYSIRGGNCYTLIERDTSAIVGFVRFDHDGNDADSTTVTLSYREGFGRDVIDSALAEIETASVIVGLQDSHEEIIDHLYANGFRRVEAEYLAKKRVPKKPET